MKKKLIFSALLFSGILISCGKSDIKTTEASSSDDIVLRAGNGTPDEELLRVWYDDGSKPGLEGKTFGCFGVGGYCSKKNVLHAIDLAVIATIIADGPNNYAAHFQTFQGQLVQIFEPTLVDGVTNGTMTLEIKGDVSNGNNAYFKFNHNGSTINVTPVGS